MTLSNILTIYKHLFFALTILFLGAVQGQELNCTVIIQDELVQTQERQVFQTMKQELEDFMNNNNWTEDEYEAEERINCNIQIQLTSGNVNSGIYSGTAQIQASRPVHGVDYETATFQFVDQYFEFKYLPGMQMFVNTNSYSNNLTSMLSFYAYMIIGFDYDSFSSEGGQKYFQLARDIMLTVPPGTSNGWNETKGPNNRFHLVDQANNLQFKELRKKYYSYHRLGMDVLEKNKQKAYDEIISFLDECRNARKNVPLSIYIESIMSAKREEIVRVFEPASKPVRLRVYQVLQRIDPKNMDRYMTLTK